MSRLEPNISPLVASQFPPFYEEEGPNLIAFAQAYYSWMEQSGNAINASRSLLDYSDIDATIDQFTQDFKDTYLNSLPNITANNLSFAVKHIQDLYKSKGSEDSVKLFFRLLFNEDVNVYRPGVDVLKASAGIWIIPEYLELTISERTKTFVGQKITGFISKATALIESVVRRSIQGRFIDIVYLSHLQGNFETGEIVSADNSLIDAPTIAGSLSSITIEDGGSNNSIGDVFNISGSNGIGGQVRISAVVSGTGQITFSIEDGGTGFTNSSSQVIISNTIVNYANATGSFLNFETVIQPLVLFNYNALEGNISVGNPVFGYASNGSLEANGFIISTNPSNTTAGALTISATGGNWNATSNIQRTANVANAQFVSVANVTVTGNVVGSNNNYIGFYNITNSFVSNGAFFYGANSNTYANSISITTGSGATFGIGSLANTETETLFTDFLSDINTGNVPYLSIFLDGHNSNVSSNGFGFPLDPTGGNSAVIGNCLETNTFIIGSIASLDNINPGSNYNAPPFIQVIDKYIKGYNRKNLIIQVSNSNNLFSPGELISQQVSNSTIAQGLVISSNSTIIDVKRMTFNTDFTANLSVQSYNSSNTLQGNAFIIAVTQDSNSLPMGYNAIITDSVTIGEGIASEGQILDSGFGYKSGDMLALNNSSSPFAISAIANLGEQGKSLGYWKDNSGKLNSDKYLHDNKYYQEYSYEIQSGLSIDKYSDIFKKIMHVSGTAFFGKVMKISVNHHTFNEATLSITNSNSLNITGSYIVVQPSLLGS